MKDRTPNDKRKEVTDKGLDVRSNEVIIIEVYIPLGTGDTFPCLLGRGPMETCTNPQSGTNEWSSAAC